MLISICASALFVSAFLLFWMQPLFTKMVLPLLGGSPAVWNTAMMFFQIVLLAGYGYAHLVSRVARPNRQFWIHGAVVIAGLGFLPFGVVHGWIPPGGSSPILWLIGLLAVSVGLPFFALSASAPLLQAWFARSGHRLSGDPYFLYAASNSGSLLALLAFPLILEPSLTLAEQARAWMVVYAGLQILICGCALPLRSKLTSKLQRNTSESGTTENRTSSRQSIGWRQRSLWIALAFVPSSLLLGVTSYIATDIASAPLLWIVPLALYLLSFIVAFSRRPLLQPALALKAEAAAIVVVTVMVLLALIFSLGASLGLVSLLHLTTFFLIALVCHTELASRRPDAEDITEFYFCMSIGGAAGGVFNALIAPLIFSAAYEYYLGLAAACALRGFIDRRSPARNSLDLVLPLLLATFVAAIAYERIDRTAPEFLGRLIFLLPTAGLLYSFRERPVRFTLGVAGVLGSAMFVQASVGVLHQERSFFGVNRVKVQNQGRQIALIHGTTAHGAEYVDANRRLEPLMYFARSGPVGQVFGSRGDLHTVGVIGLGTGALSCYSKPGQEWTFYEIDGAIERIALNAAYFHYLDSCGRGVKIVLGDGRLSIRTAPNNYYDLIIIDAFSSDSIPLHLITKEAMSLYMEKLAAHGTILFHISNRYLRLAPVVATLAETVGAVARDELYDPSPQELAQGATASEWIAIARSNEDLAFLDKEPRWKPLVSRPGARPWTDDFSNIVSVIKW
jgi:spermidine synthase